MKILKIRLALQAQEMTNEKIAYKVVEQAFLWITMSKNFIQSCFDKQGINLSRISPDEEFPVDALEIPHWT